MLCDLGGIGPADQLRIVRSSTDGPTMISNDSWIDLPVGYNLNDHVNVSCPSQGLDVALHIQLTNLSL